MKTYLIGTALCIIGAVIVIGVGMGISLFDMPKPLVLIAVPFVIVGFVIQMIAWNKSRRRFHQL